MAGNKHFLTSLVEREIPTDKATEENKLAMPKKYKILMTC